MANVKRKAGEILDSLTTNPWTSFPIFLIIVYFLFWCTFSLGRYPMEWIQNGIDSLGGVLDGVLRPEWLRALTVDGILAGMGGVLVYLPNIVILYALISIMESSGYMGRVAYIMDRLMHGMGLHGKSFVPMIMGFGCNVPAILATKDIGNRKNRLITVLIIPFMSCSGRLPVYLLLTAAFFPEYGPPVLLGIYAVGMLVAVCAAKILSLIIPGKSEHDFVELHRYRLPDMRYVARNTWGQITEYISKVAGPILVFSIALWVLGYFPHDNGISDSAQQKEMSYIGKVGHSIEPVLEPLGMNWKDGVAIVAGVGAKEITVSTLGVMYSSDADTLQEALLDSHTAAGALAFMIFVLLYFPCIGTFSALIHATGGWKWPLVSAISNLLIAWLAAFCVYNVFSL